MPAGALKRVLHRAVRAGCAVIAAATIGLAAAPAAASPPLWRVSDGDSTVWLFGTVHALQRGEPNWRPAADLTAAMAESQSFWLETEIPTEDPSASLARLGRSPDEPLSSRFAPADYARLADVADGLGVDLADLDELRPWLAAMTLVSASLRRGGFDQSGADGRLLRDAASLGLEVAGFDPADRPLALYAGLDPADERALLLSTVDDLAGQQPQHERLVAAWLAGDEAALEAIGLDEMRAAGEGIYDRFITERNRGFAERIEGLMLGRGTHFVAIGALHLVGPDRIQNALLARGLSVERVER